MMRAMTQLTGHPSNPRRYAVFAPGSFATRGAKTAHGVIAYGIDEIAVVVDRDCAGKRVLDVMPHLRRDAPIVGSLREALAFAPTALLIGVAPPGGALPDDWRSDIRAALDAGLEVVNGLHEGFTSDAEFRAAAVRGRTVIWDVRVPPPVELFSGAAWDLAVRIVLTVGTDCNCGKMTASLELARAANERGVRTGFVATGQTGIMIAGDGIAIDEVVSDFAPGAVEQVVVRNASGRDLLFVEGQGGITHPAYAPVTLALLYGAAPDALVLVHPAARTVMDGFGTPLPTYREAIQLYESLCAGVKPAKVVGIALNTLGLDDPAARTAIERARSETNLPADDVVRYGPHALYDAIAPAVVKTRARSESARTYPSRA